MDALSGKYSKEPAMIVDWDHVCAFPEYAEYVAQKQKHVEVVMLVPNPFGSDFVQTVKSDNEYVYLTDIEPTVVLRNNGGLRDVIFKAQAVSIIQDMSNLVPVAAWDDDPEVLDMYRAAGVVFTDDIYWK
jgi:hypothetical protein